MLDCKLTSEFADVMTKILIFSSPKKHQVILNVSCFDTPLGPMLAIADEKELYVLEFFERRGLQREIERLCLKNKCAIVSGKTDPITSIESELTSYFSGKLQIFKTPLRLMGTPFQKKVWTELMTIPYGETRSYLEQAKAIKKETAYRAVANANGANQLAIIIPCHRIINNNGNLGGYGGGIARKQWLLEHEKKNSA
ncbi:MAG: methylated-DNA--[protein]-cysteine S-methyltransferase [Gammaproteobacteria bacterium]|nr:methylated-DNA--[protein]-cysteine S-methyltransferase [Gammaproteobacteria bacterium]